MYYPHEFILEWKHIMQAMIYVAANIFTFEHEYNITTKK